MAGKKKNRKLNKEHLLILIAIALSVIAVIFTLVLWLTQSRKTESVLEPTFRPSATFQPTLLPSAQPEKTQVLFDGCQDVELRVEFTIVPTGWRCTHWKDEEGNRILALNKDGVEVKVHENRYGGYLCTIEPHGPPGGHCTIETFYSNELMEVKLYTYTEDDPYVGSINNKGVNIILSTETNFEPSISKGGSSAKLYLTPTETAQVIQILQGFVLLP